MEPVAWAEGLPRARASGVPRSDLACLEHGAQKRLLGQNVLSRWEQVSLPASLGKARLKTRWCRHCSRAGC